MKNETKSIDLFKIVMTFFAFSLLYVLSAKIYKELNYYEATVQVIKSLSAIFAGVSLILMVIAVFVKIIQLVEE